MLLPSKVIVNTFYFSGSNENCRNCISTKLCMTSSGFYLNFSRLFNHTLSKSPCELHLNDEIYYDSLNEEICIEISSNMTYYILCPVCDQVIYYELPNSTFSNIEDCSHSGKCFEIKIKYT